MVLQAHVGAQICPGGFALTVLCTSIVPSHDGSKLDASPRFMAAVLTGIPPSFWNEPH